MTRTLVLLRHGQSIWNAANLFTGWTDVDLSSQGRDEARNAGQLMAEAGLRPDVVHTSVLRRAIDTADLALDSAGWGSIPVTRDWRLNERHYGALQGLNKKQMAEDCGGDRVLAWRRAYDVRPPALDPADPRHPINDPRYDNLDDPPGTECLKDVVERMVPYWRDRIAPDLNSGGTVLVAAHGNSLRALVKHLDDVADEEIVGLNIPTGIPLVYRLDDALQPLESSYLGDPEAAKAAAEAVGKQAG